MDSKNRTYKAIVSSDWNECLAPCGPFDFISFNYPQLTAELEEIFKQYTGNSISLGEAVRQIEKLLPEPITEKQMDHYLDESYAIYNGVPELVEWCMNHNILFMINTTGMIGYFQRVFAKNLLPEVTVLSAHPMVRYATQNTDPDHIFDLLEIEDKFKNTEAVARSFSIPSNKIILIGDSGGDGPHFKWGAGINALLIGSMTKPSLKRYCAQHNISIDSQFGISYAEKEDKNLHKEMQTNFIDLLATIENYIDA